MDGIKMAAVTGNAGPSFSVWLGSLDEQVDEQTLKNIFSKFGPVRSVYVAREGDGKSKGCGYVNYFNREVADTAALAMNGCKMFGSDIKTKGPSEHESKTELSDLGERKDYRPLTDCVFFMESKECAPKNGEVSLLSCSACG